MSRAKTWAVMGTDRSKRFYGSRESALHGAIQHAEWAPDEEFHVWCMVGRRPRLYTVARGNR